VDDQNSTRRQSPPGMEGSLPIDDASREREPRSANRARARSGRPASNPRDHIGQLYPPLQTDEPRTMYSQYSASTRDSTSNFDFYHGSVPASPSNEDNHHDQEYENAVESDAHNVNGGDRPPPANSGSGRDGLVPPEDLIPFAL